VNEPDTGEPRRLSRPQMVAAVAAGIAVGGLAGAVIRGSGSVYDTWFLAGCLFLLLALAGLGGLRAARTQRTNTARILGGFAGVALITAGVAYAVAPPYRSPSADLLHRGSITVHVTQPAAMEWSGRAECRTRPHEPTVFQVFMQGLKVEDRDVMVLLHLSPGTTSLQAELTLDLLSPAGSVDYVASSGNGLDATQIAADGLSGSSRFSAVRVPVPARSPEPEPDRLTGTLEWSCGSTPSG